MITINPLTCDHVVGDDTPDLVVTLNLNGAAADIFVNDIAMGWRAQAVFYYGQATVWIKDDGGADVAGATVTVQWYGDVSGAAQGVTGSDGKILKESLGKKYGGTFVCTVTDVVKSGYTYNPGFNVETSDSITASLVAEPIPEAL